nr:GIY-YIG nuclease family protein [uncultured Dongia sp.]
MSDVMRNPKEPSYCFVYILGCRTARGYRTYVGWTLDLERRLAQHNNGTGAKSTRGGAWTLLYTEQYETRREAMSREWHLKRDRNFRRSIRPEKEC